MDKETVVYICTMEYYSAIKNNKIMAFAGNWMKLKSVMLSEKPISKNQRMDDLADKQMMTHHGHCVGQARGRRDCIEGKEGWEGCGKRKNNRMNQTSLPYVNI